jgi:hypothetical protein
MCQVRKQKKCGWDRRTNSRSSFWEASICAGTDKLPNISCNPNVSWRVYKSHPVISILRQIIIVHITSFSFSKIHLNVFYPPTTSSSHWSLSFRLFHRYSIRIPILPHWCYMPCPLHHPNCTCWRVQGMKLLIMHSYPTSSRPIPLQFKDSPQHGVLKTICVPT